MSIPASLWAKSLPIPANEKAVLREMADIVRKAVNQCWASQVRIGAALTKSDRHVREMQLRLEHRGLIRRNGKIGRSIRWVLNVGAMPKDEAAPPPNGLCAPEADREIRAAQPGNPAPENRNDFPGLISQRLEPNHEPECVGAAKQPGEAAPPAPPETLPGLDQFRAIYPRAATALTELEVAYAVALARCGGDPTPILEGIRRQQPALHKLTHLSIGNRCPGPVRWLTEHRWLDGSQAEPRRSASTTTQVKSGVEWFETAIRDGKRVSFAWRILNLQYPPFERDIVRARYRDLLDQHGF